MAEFKLSSLGRYYVTNEGITEVPDIRVGFVVITIILGIGILVKLTAYFMNILSLPKRHKRNHGGLLTTMFLTHFISYAIHTIHYADNIYRPVAYLEPRWLYVKYLISEMEITFFANFPISFVGMVGLQGLMTGINEGNGNLVRANCKRLVFYVLGSLLTLGHYRTEFPSHYSPFVNFTIAGEGIVTIIFAVLLGYCYWGRFKQMDVDLGDNEVCGKLLDSSDAELERPVDSRVRSRTPVRSKK